VFVDSTGRRKALVFVDSAQKEDALAILDKRFLSAIAHQSDAYRKWFDKYAVFSYGTTEKTSPMIACLNKFCDLVNCVIGIINGSGSDCQQEGADAKQTCEIAGATSVGST
jgi:hypothetical protein